MCASSNRSSSKVLPVCVCVCVLIEVVVSIEDSKEWSGSESHRPIIRRNMRNHSSNSSSSSSSSSSNHRCSTMVSRFSFFLSFFLSIHARQEVKRARECSLIYDYADAYASRCSIEILQTCLHATSKCICLLESVQSYTLSSLLGRFSV